MITVASVRGRALSLAGTFAGLALGVALIAMSLLVYASAQPRPPERLSAAPVLVHGPVLPDASGVGDGVRPWPGEQAQALAGRLAVLPGVAAAVPDRTFYAQLVVEGRPVGDPEETGAGHGWASAALGAYPLVDGTGPDADGEVAAGAATGLAVGDRTTLLTGGGPAEVTVTGLVDGPGVYVSEEAAARLSPGVAAIGLLLHPDADPAAVAAAARAAAPDATVSTGDGRAVLEPAQAAKTRWLGTQLLIAMASLAVFVTVFVVASTFALSIAQRRRELGLLRTVGATPRQIRRMVMGEALLVGGAGGLAGALLGVAAAVPAARLLADWGLAEPGLRIRPEPLPVLAAVLVGVGVALTGAYAAARRAAKVPPMAALREASVEARAMGLGRWLLGGSALALGGFLAARTATAAAEDRVNSALFAAMALTAAAALLAPVLLPPLIRLAGLPLRGSRGAGAMLVRAETLAAVRRTAATAAPVIATIGFAVLLSGMVATMREAYPAGQAAKLAGLTIAVPDGTPGLPATAVTTGGRSVLPTRVYAGDLSVAAFGTTGGPTSMAARIADAVGVRASGTVTVRFADGHTERLTIGEITPDGQVDDDLILPQELVRKHDPSALATSLLGADPAALAGHPGVEVLDAKAYAEREGAEDGRLLWLFATVLIALSVGYTGIAVANTMAMSADGRRPDLGVLRRAGATTRQLLRYAAAETLLVVALGAGLGLAVTVPPLLGMAAGLEQEVGAPVTLRLHWPVTTATMLATAALAVAAAVLATRRAARRAMSG
ncbi:ABC transporter permease [Catellatospora sp. IY07-71]|uniref:FtsX-like permease family protein n=1 Tax=Catellatospora sp. IY07-71 TaxID=2728827 RepID=UPI001BB2F574|nr:ABC transporter permease [Catellatospora sp. IY07-71]BCJ73631.1 ABC transporter permease [Catellatospora sp. IY07-71]